VTAVLEERMIAVETPRLRPAPQEFVSAAGAEQTPLLTLADPRVRRLAANSRNSPRIEPTPLITVADLRKEVRAHLIRLMRQFEQASLPLTATIQATAAADPTIKWFDSRDWSTILEGFFRAFDTLAAPSMAGPEFAMVEDLARWLRSSKAEIATMIGAGRTTPYTWLRESRQPRPLVRRKLYQSHALASGLVRRLGEDTAIRWLCDESTVRRSNFLRGDTDAVQREAHRILFTPTRRRARPGGWSPPESDVDFE
jgi:hypothetical protein